MNIYLCFGYEPNTAGLYFERALAREHHVVTLGAPVGIRTGYVQDLDLSLLPQDSLPAPDLVIFMEPFQGFFPAGLHRLVCPTAIYLVDVHRHLPLRLAYARFFDYVFVAQKDYVPRLREQGIEQVFWLPLACDPDIHRPLQLPKQYDVGFVGHLNSHARTRRLEATTQCFSVNDYRQRYAREQIAEVYSMSRMALNSSIGGDLNMRVFEAMACGTLLVTDRIGNGQSDLFEDRVHLVEYANDQEMLDAIEYYLAHDDERTKISHCGAELVRSHHTYQQRSDTMLQTIFADGAPRFAAPIRQLSDADAQLVYLKFYARLGQLDVLVSQLQARTRRPSLRMWSVLAEALARSTYRLIRLGGASLHDVA